MRESLQASSRCIDLTYDGLDASCETSPHAPVEHLTGGTTHVRMNPDSVAIARATSDSPKQWRIRPCDACALVAIFLRQSVLTLTDSNKRLYDGVIDHGTALLAPPDCEVQASFHTPGDFLHIHVPDVLVKGWIENGEGGDALSLFEVMPIFIRDALVTKLAGTLVRALSCQRPSSVVYSEGIALSILACLMEELGSRTAAKRPRTAQVAPLEAWRLKVATDYIDRQIDKGPTLADLGAAVGLSPMHFAARFHAATGTSPHTFVLRRRVEMAQTLLATTTLTVADIAFSVGFRTQAHFTAVFRRHVDDTPARWRAKQAATLAVVRTGT